MASETVSTKDLDLPRAMLETATSVQDWYIILPLALCLLGGSFLLLFRNQRHVQFSMTLLLLFTILVIEASLFWRVLADGPVAMTMGNWLPPFGITFLADTLGVGFAMVSTFVTIIVVIYFQAEIVTREVRYGFYPLILLLLSGVIGSFMTADLFNLYVWFEVMLIASFGLLIMGGRKIQLDAAIKYGFLNFLATTIFLIGLGFLYGSTGTLNMADLVRVAPDSDPIAMTAIAGLFFLAFGMKAAAFPVNGWLPASYHAPDPAISALFGGLLTKVGAYALIRTLILLLPAARENFAIVISVVAALTLILGPLGAIAQTNLRRAIGFLVIGGIGSILAGIAIANFRGIAGGSFYALSSILVMTALYLVAGLIERVTGQTDTRSMGGVYRANSWISILFLMLVFAAAGLPPFLGFWPKLLLVQGAFENLVFEPQSSFAVWGMAIPILINSILTTIAGSRLWAHIFLRDGKLSAPMEMASVRDLTSKEKFTALAATTILVLVIFALGLFPHNAFLSFLLSTDQLTDATFYLEAVKLEVPQ